MYSPGDAPHAVRTPKKRNRCAAVPAANSEFGMTRPPYPGGFSLPGDDLGDFGGVKLDPLGDEVSQSRLGHRTATASSHQAHGDRRSINALKGHIAAVGLYCGSYLLDGKGHSVLDTPGGPRKIVHISSVRLAQRQLGGVSFPHGVPVRNRELLSLTLRL